MKRSRAEFIPVLITLIVVLLGWILQWSQHHGRGLAILQRLEWDTLDARVRHATNQLSEVSDQLGVVYISDEAVVNVQQTFGPAFGLPFPRQLHGCVLGELHEQGALAVGFDIFFAERQADYPETRITTLEGTEVSSDAYFAHELARTGIGILAVAEGLTPSALFATNALDLADITTNERDEDGVLRRVKPFRDYRIWHPFLRGISDEYTLLLGEAVVEPKEIRIPQQAQADGTQEWVTIPLDDQGRFRMEDLTGVPPENPALAEALPFEERRIWHLGFILAARAMGGDLEAAQVSATHIDIPLHDGGLRHIPLDSDGMFLVDWALAWNDKRITKAGFDHLLTDVEKRRQGLPVGDEYKGKVVVIGSTATGNNISDLGATPLSAESFLVSTHWNVANSILLGRFVKRVGRGWDYALVAAMSVIPLLMRWRFSALVGSLGVALVAGGYLMLAFQFYSQALVWVPVVMPVGFGLALSHLGLVSFQVIFEQREKRRVKNVFSKLVSPNVVNELLMSEELNLGGTRRRITVFFADVRGFTRMTDEYQARAEQYVSDHALQGDAAEKVFDEQARETLSTVNAYLSTIADMVKKHDGTLDKYMGDCVMAFWGAPTPNERHALSCVQAAIEAQRAMAHLNHDRLAENERRRAENNRRIAEGLEPLPMLTILSLGTGINTGTSIVGLMGSDSHILNFTVFGREVNLASRLEHVSGRGRIIISQSTYEDLQKYDPALASGCVEQESVYVKGIKDAVRIYEVPWRSDGTLGEEPDPDAVAPTSHSES